MSPADKAESFVTKSFLIDIITRDIGIMDAILELVDNSLDRAVEMYKIDVTRSLTEEYNFTSDLRLPQPITVNKDDEGQWRLEFYADDIRHGVSLADILVFDESRPTPIAGRIVSGGGHVRGAVPVTAGGVGQTACRGAEGPGDSGYG